MRSRILLAGLIGAGMGCLLISTGAEPQPKSAPNQERPAAERLAEADELIATGRKLRQEGNSAEAEALLKRALELRREVLGLDDPAVARATDELGSVYFNRAQYGEAEALYRQALAIAEKALGPRNLDVADFLGDLGATLREEQKYTEAEQIVQRSLSIRILLLPKDDPAIGASLNNLGRNYLKQGRYRDAEPVLAESVRIYHKTYGDDDPRVRRGTELLNVIARGKLAPPPTEIVTRDVESRVSLRLNSGATVSLLNMGPIISPQGWAGFVLVYETAATIEDEITLRREADEIWEHFIVNVEKSHYDKALIVAKSTNAAAVRRSVIFLFTLQKDGWRTDERANVSKLDEEFVREFVTRYDWLVEHQDAFGAALYLSEDWTATIRITDQGQEQTSVLDRDQFIAAVRAMSNVARGYKHQREILAITIDPDGKSAKIKSREVETFERNGMRVKTVGTSVDLLTLSDNHVQYTRSAEEATRSTENRL